MQEIKKLFKNKKINSESILLFIFLLIVALLPIHAILSTWTISNFGHSDIIKSWKEILLYGLAFPLIIWTIYKRPLVIQRILKENINVVVLSFITINVFLLGYSSYGLRSETAGFIFNTRFLAFFLFAQILAIILNKAVLEKAVFWIICIGGSVVSIFGLLQMTIFPKNILSHIGYSKTTILPYYTIANNSNFVRIISTLRGPNELGAYMVFWLPILLIVTLKNWDRGLKFRYIAGMIWIASIITLYGSGSRSAIIASLASVSIAVYFIANKQIKKNLLIITLIIGVIASIALIAGRNTRFEQFTLLHKDVSVQSGTTSNYQHYQSLKVALKIIKEHPLGLGVGTTNVPSTYGPQGLTIENYFLEMMVETGIIGGILFLLICIILAFELWKNQDDDIAKALLAGLIGISIAAMLLPAWEDETLSMLFWGLAGIVITKKINLKEQNHKITLNNK